MTNNSCCNELSKIPMEIGYLHNLVLLDLSKNSLTSLPETIMYLTKLVDLKLSFNQLESIPAGIGGLTKLAALSLDNNRLESIPSQIGLIKGLINLDLSDNPITVLPAEVGKLQFLRRLKLDRCPLVESFSHSPLHSPPTLLELAARVIVRHDVPVPPMTLPHLKTYLKSANTCTFCDGPYFDASVKRGKMIEKNDMFIPLEYTLCQPHWNTELERIKLLFCKRPITSPPANASSVPQGTIGHINVAKRQSQRPALTARSTSGSTNSTLGSTFDLESSSAASTAAGAASGTSRPRNRKYASEGDRSLSFVGNRLSMLLGPRGGDKRERPTSTYRTASMPVVATSANAGSTSATAGSSRLASLSSSSSSSGVGTPRIQTNGAAIVQEGNGEQPIRPRVRRSVTSGILARAAFKLRRPLSMASAFETASVPVGHLDDLGTSSSATDADAATATN
ncbi:hypothetical protein BC939DRAFT_447726 [Gamsiella multidivaricata]|uniref:uncharacterized protein n=1 Tax=Gamsiella multidivaricata TaxID=101098 RepID=UPI00221EFA5C|nr:uncharacterized protein BC939DRAFT_447726 [Gamsiella multidivaricata]KAG0366386.1 hypothetical protein BGZ54_005416 [Gamsiella multidivaricata]KAI7826080.1 hypothetical protein BC939DRAFT_447726 [Gamsiella multidivaricata]